MTEPKQPRPAAPPLPALTIIDIDPELAYHLHKALDLEIEWAKRVGCRLPQRIYTFHQAMRSKVIESQARTRAEFTAPTEHSEIQEPPLLVPYAEAARRLALSKRTIGRMIADGELRPVSVGKTKRIAVADIERLAQRRDSHT